MKIPRGSYHMKISDQVHALEQTAHGLRDLATACQRMGLEKVSDELYWRANNLDEITINVDKLIIAFLKNEQMCLEDEKAQLKQILEKANR